MKFFLIFKVKDILSESALSPFHLSRSMTDHFSAYLRLGTDWQCVEVHSATQWRNITINSWHSMQDHKFPWLLDSRLDRKMDESRLGTPWGRGINSAWVYEEAFLPMQRRGQKRSLPLRLLAHTLKLDATKTLQIGGPWRTSTSCNFRFIHGHFSEFVVHIYVLNSFLFQLNTLKDYLLFSVFKPECQISLVSCCLMGE